MQLLHLDAGQLRDMKRRRLFAVLALHRISSDVRLRHVEGRGYSERRLAFRGAVRAKNPAIEENRSSKEPVPTQLQGMQILAS